MERKACPYRFKLPYPYCIGKLCAAATIEPAGYWVCAALGNVFIQVNDTETNEILKEEILTNA